MMRRHAGFSLLELTIVLVVIGLFFAVGAPASSRLFDTMQYRESLGVLASAAKKARRQALASGQPVDLLIDTDQNAYHITDEGVAPALDQFTKLDGEIALTVVYAAEVAPEPGLATIRFYPAGGSSGGDITVTRTSGAGTRLVVDWLLGDVVTEAL